MNISTLQYQNNLIHIIQSEDMDTITNYVTMHQGNTNVSFQEKNIELMQTTSTLARALIFHNIPASYCLYLSEHHINILLTKHTVQQLLEFEHTIIHDYYTTLFRFTKSNHPTIQQILNYIFMPSVAWLHLEDIANHCNLNKSYVSSLFKKEMQQTITTYIQEHKIKQIKEMLHYTTEPLIEIATINHFTSYSYFSKIFKKHVGITPKQYYLQHNIHKKK